MRPYRRKWLPGLYDLVKIWKPSLFQGTLVKNSYFEGWYFKLVSPEGEYKLSFIPGVSLGKDPHSFIQVINGKTGKTAYYRFELNEFKYSQKQFAVQIAGNFFCEEFLSVELENETEIFKGKIEFTKFKKFPVSMFRPGIMGWYRFVPFMECYHGVVSLGHRLQGSLSTNQGAASFDNGKGYVEKDWGKSMPKAWIWMQGNNFEENKEASFMLSVARIPWLGSSFTGFLGYLDTGGVLYPFATYTGAKIKTLSNKENQVDITIEDRHFKLIISGLKGKRGNLKAPVAGNMERSIHESLEGIVQIKLFNRKKEELFSGKAIHAGLELVGDPALLR
jgi:tocopherol cyclase